MQRRKRCAVLFAVEMMLAGFFAVLPLQAEEAADAAFTMNEQTEMVSENNAPEAGEPTGEVPTEEPTEESSEQEGDAPEEELPKKQQEISPDPKKSPEQNTRTSENQTTTKPEITSEPQDACVEAGGYASFHVSATGKDLQYQWFVDRGDGSSFQEIRGANTELYQVMVFDGAMNGYMYQCKVTSGNTDNNGNGSGEKTNGNGAQGADQTNYVRTRAAKLTIYYRIAGGARSVWVKSSGRGLVFQGSGAYSKFSGINVDGSRITAGEYNKGGSQTTFTEITLLRSYLETLVEGDHELEIVWTDGSAKTSFRIEAPAANLPADASGTGKTGALRAGKTGAADADLTADTTGSRRLGTTPSASDMIMGKDGADRISGNTIKESLSENTLKIPADVPGTLDMPTEKEKKAAEKKLAVTPGERRTQKRPSNDKRNPVRLAAMSKKVNQYAAAVCMAVMSISAAGIISGMIAYRLHDTEGHKD